MLGELYQYAIDNGLTARPGFKQKNVKYYIHFDLNGRFLGFDILEDEMPKPYCPDIGSYANGATKSNIIAEKARVVLNLPEKDGRNKSEQKHKFYRQTLETASQYDEQFIPAVKGMEEHLEEIIQAYLAFPKSKPDDFISIKVNGQPLENSSGYLTWWETFRKSFETKKSTQEVRCFITNELAEPMKTVPSVSGLASVGGHSKGDSLICFDKDAFQSYGFKKAANATVSEGAVTAVNAALEKLLREAPPPLAGAKWIHWFSQKTEHDVLQLLDFGFETTEELSSDDTQNQEDENKVQKLLHFVQNKNRPKMPKNRYYIMSLSGVNGRVMIRSYDEGTYDELCNKICQWYDDIGINEPRYGYRYPKLFRIYSRLLKFSTNKTKLSERIAEELSGLAPQIMYAILHGTPLPDTAAAKALAYIRSDMYAGNDDNAPKIKNIDVVSCQILKAWLNRKYRNQNKEEFCIMDNLNEQSPSKAYQSGRLMAVYAALQRAALGDVGAGVVERYYTSACTSPALVMGKLATMAQYHLSKLEQGSKIYYSRMLQEISIQIGTSLPATFTLEEQSQFALGFYFQTAEIYKSKKTNPETEE